MVSANIIDDESISRRLMESALEHADIEHLGSAPDGGRGLALFFETEPTIVLLDIRMPGMDGHEVLAEMRRYRPQAFILMVSAATDFKSISHSMYGGAQDFLRKDLGMAEIVDRLKHHAERFKRGDHATIHERVATNLSDTGTS